MYRCYRYCLVIGVSIIIRIFTILDAVFIGHYVFMPEN
jgi:hypothetical protein